MNETKTKHLNELKRVLDVDYTINEIRVKKFEINRTAINANHVGKANS